MKAFRIMLAGAVALAGPAAFAQEKSSTGQDAKDVVTQPVRDVGIAKKKIPPVLLAAADAPYATAGTGSCARLTSAIRALNAELGPDFDSDEAPRKASVVKVGGEAVVNTLIPFRGLVREVSGAASADRQLAAATQAGIARRGFLRGMYRQRGCRTGL